MALAKLRYLTEDEVLAVADPILSNLWSDYGYAGADISEEEDFDGAYIFRLNANVSEKVPTKSLFEAMDGIHVALRKLGENRFVILSSVLPHGENNATDYE